MMFVAVLTAGPALAHEGHELECEQTCALGNFCEEHPHHKVCQDDHTPNSGGLEGSEGSKVHDVEGNEGSKVHDVEGAQRKARKQKPQARSVREVPVGGVDAGGGQAEPPSGRKLAVFIVVALAALTSVGYGLYRLLALRT